MVEFALVFPIFILLVLGATVVYSWLLDINSASFATEEGIQFASAPGNASGNGGLLCQSSARAYTAATQVSFLGSTTLVGDTASLPPGLRRCAASSTQPDYGASCPSPMTSTPPTFGQMLSQINALAPGITNGVLICAWCWDTRPANPMIPAHSCTSGPPPSGQDQLQLVITMVGWKPVPVGLPFIGKRMPFYGQQAQTLQAFQA